MVQSLLYQVLSADHKFFRYVRGKQLFRRQLRGDFGQYMELLSVVLQDTSLSETVIVLDALNQCEESSRSLLIESMKAIASQSKVKVLFTSRSIPAVKIEPSIGIDMDYTNEHVECDINRYVMTAVKDLARERKLPVQLEIDITLKLLKLTSKSFLWVQFALRSIADSLTLRILRNKLDRLTPSLTDLYSEALNRSYGLAAVNLRRTLYFVMIAEEPLQVQELSALLAISQTWDSRVCSSQGSDLNTIRMEISSADLSDNKISVLQAALRMHSNTVIDFLFEDEDFRDAVDRKRWTALHVAADEGNELVAPWLIETGIWINAGNSQGDAALHLVTRKGFTGLVRLLCKLGSVVDLQNSSGQLPAHLAAETGDEDTLQTLCKYSTYFLHRDAEGRTALHVASMAGSEATVHILVAAGANVDTQDNYGRIPVHYAVESRDLKILDFLLITGADPWTPDNYQICPIHLAAERGSDLLIRELLKDGVSPDCRDLQGRTPLHHCCSSKVATSIAAGILLESGVKIQASDSKGAHPIHLAAEKGSESLVKLLISYGADLNCPDTEGRSPLHYSCSSKRPTTAVVRLLIHNRTNVNHRDHDMNTPLYYAEQNSKKSVIELLKDAGACF